MGTGAAAALLTGCSLNNPFRAASSEPTGQGAVSGTDPDVALAVQAIGLIRATSAAAAARISAFPALSSRLGDLVALHQAHAAALSRAVPHGSSTTTKTPPPAPAGSRHAALVAQASAEAALRDELVALAVRAESGPFARLLGTMAAGISQRLPGLAA